MDVDVCENTNDEEYLSLLKNSLNQLEKINSDIIFFQAGVDSLKSDRYGKLELSIDGLSKRNHYIFKFAKKEKTLFFFLWAGVTLFL